MSNEEQIFAYKELRNNGQAFFIDNYEDADRIIEALEKQIPKEPIDKIMYKECPICGAVDLGRYCMECGQAIKWE